MNLENIEIVQILAESLLYAVEVQDEGRSGITYRLTDGTLKFLGADNKETLETMTDALWNGLVGNADFVWIHNAVINISHLEKVAPHMSIDGTPLFHFAFRGDINFALTYDSIEHAKEDIKKFSDAWQVSILMKQRENEHKVKPNTH